MRAATRDSTRVLPISSAPGAIKTHLLGNQGLHASLDDLLVTVYILLCCAEIEVTFPMHVTIVFMNDLSVREPSIESMLKGKGVGPLVSKRGGQSRGDDSIENLGRVGLVAPE